MKIFLISLIALTSILGTSNQLMNKLISDDASISIINNEVKSTANFNETVFSFNVKNASNSRVSAVIDWASDSSSSVDDNDWKVGKVASEYVTATVNNTNKTISLFCSEAFASQIDFYLTLESDSSVKSNVVKVDYQQRMTAINNSIAYIGTLTDGYVFETNFTDVKTSGIGSIPADLSMNYNLDRIVYQDGADLKSLLPKTFIEAHTSVPSYYRPKGNSSYNYTIDEYLDYLNDEIINYLSSLFSKESDNNPFSLSTLESIFDYEIRSDYHDGSTYDGDWVSGNNGVFSTFLSNIKNDSGLFKVSYSAYGKSYELMFENFNSSSTASITVDETKVVF